MESWDIALLRLLPPPCELSDQGANIIALMAWVDAARPLLRLRATSRRLEQCVAPHFDSRDWGLHFSTHCAEMRGIEQAYQEFVAEQHLEFDGYYAD